ncbi:MAG: hypothetical protein ACQEP5_04205 [Actinomycetota bacterium]
MTSIDINIDQHILQEVDRIRKIKGMNRSRFFQEAAELYIKQYAKKKGAIKEAIRMQNRLRRQAGKWDGVVEIRKWRDSI